MCVYIYIYIHTHTHTHPFLYATLSVPNVTTREGKRGQKFPYSVGNRIYTQPCYGHESSLFPNAWNGSSISASAGSIAGTGFLELCV